MQLIVLDIMLGHFVLMEHPMESTDPIVGICFTESSNGGNGNDDKGLILFPLWDLAKVRFLGCVIPPLAGL